MPEATPRALMQQPANLGSRGTSAVAPQPAKPFNIGGIGAPLQVRTEGPPSVIADAQQGTRPIRWAPGVGANTAQAQTGRLPYGDAPKPRVPFTLR